MIKLAIVIIVASVGMIYGSIRYQDHLIDEMNERPNNGMLLTWEQCEQEGLDCR